MNTDKKEETSCFVLSVFIHVHPWPIRLRSRGAVAQLFSSVLAQSLAHLLSMRSGVQSLVRAWMPCRKRSCSKPSSGSSKARALSSSPSGFRPCGARRSSWWWTTAALSRGARTINCSSAAACIPGFTTSNFELRAQLPAERTSQNREFRENS